MNFKPLLLLLCLSLAACQELGGTITLHRDTKVIDKKGKPSLISKGSYRASLKYQEKKRRIKLKIKDATQNRKDIKLNIAVPVGVLIPEHSGPIHLKAEKIGQPFDLNGDLKTHTAYSERRRGVERCTYTVHEYVCHKVCREYKQPKGAKGKKTQHKPKKGSTKCRKKCGYEHVAHPGFRDVEYHYVTKTVILDAKLNQPASLAVIGDLNVSRSDTHKFYDFTGVCH